MNTEEIIEAFKKTTLPKVEQYNTLIERIEDLKEGIGNAQEEEEAKGLMRLVEDCIEAIQSRFPTREVGTATYIYKAEGNYEDFEDDDIIYVPEDGYEKVDLLLIHASIPEECYTKKDFFEIAGEDAEEADCLFCGVTWQHPETLQDEHDQDAEEQLEIKNKAELRTLAHAFLAVYGDRFELAKQYITDKTAVNYEFTCILDSLNKDGQVSEDVAHSAVLCTDNNSDFTIECEWGEFSFTTMDLLYN